MASRTMVGGAGVSSYSSPGIYPTPPAAPVTTSTGGSAVNIVLEPPRHKFTESEVKLVMDWHLEAKFHISVAHLRKSNQLSLLDSWLGMPAIVVCTVAACMAMGTERTKDGEVFRYFLCILSVFGTILNFIFANTQFPQRAQQHKNSWAAYRVFANDAEAAMGRHAAADRWFHAQQHLDTLYERWKELHGPLFDPTTAGEVPLMEPPKSAEAVVRQWQQYAERELMRNQIAAREYDRFFFLWRALWMVVVALCSAASLGTFLPKNTEWPIVFSYCSLILNIWAVIILAFMAMQRYMSLSAQHQLTALKCRALQDRAGRLLASRSGSGVSHEQRMADAIEILRPMINEIQLCMPPIPHFFGISVERRLRQSVSQQGAGDGAVVAAPATGVVPQPMTGVHVAGGAEKSPQMSAAVVDPVAHFPEPEHSDGDN